MIVKHIESGAIYRVKKDCGEILVCHLEEPIITKWDSVVTMCILSRDNVEILETDDNQLTLFEQ